MSQNFRFVRKYVGGLKAAILDWSGTTADKYVIAPAVVFVEVFEKHKVPISMKEARLPMGLRKDLHIKAITEQPEVRERWRSVYGRDPNQGDVDNMFKDFVPLQLGCLRKYTELIPGTVQAVDTLKKEYGMKIGSTTGFIRSMVDVLLEDAKKQGFHPDCTVAGDEVANGARPKPFMVYRNLDLLDVHPIQAVVKVDDTISGVGEALEAGCWGVGLARYSNYMDVDSFEHEKTLSEDEIQRRLEISRDLLRKSGAHYVIDTIADLPEVVADINSRLARGESP
ncbi:phosphonoacetaldehyde hydrolase-like [Mercenaria mercenaria]|uniref:phosphonoacetaldehyde hydrolase-like n=1 Tax=Mercenaria mercenaria TaxID=6596 RepID=UPI001E1D4107|nr:phosphonoacetaldehyde hydrolase-like [Mercenaria mercenaria]XP_045180080.1 phosphonoacetaldehyde hydrolase-like [Mercenaria mercenaria]